MVFGLVPCLSTISWLGRGPLRNAFNYAYEEPAGGGCLKVGLRTHSFSVGCKSCSGEETSSITGSDVTLSLTTT